MRVARYELPFTKPDGAVAFVLPENRRAVGTIFRLKNRQQALAFQWKNGPALVNRRMARARDLDKSRHQVGDVSELSGDGAGLANDRRPTGDEGRSDAALMNKMFVEA